MRRPLLLDLYCGAGGASMGYYQAGFDVIGVDINPQPHYPFRFTRRDALRQLKVELRRNAVLTVIHASPPCQRYCDLSVGTNARHEIYVDMIDETNRIYQWRILHILNERFVAADSESNIDLPQPEHIKHRGRVAGMRHYEWFDGYYYAVYGTGGGKGSLHDWQRAMRISWMPHKSELSQAIPPAYTKYIGTHLISRIQRGQAIA